MNNFFPSINLSCGQCYSSIETKGDNSVLDKRWVNFAVCSVCGLTWKTALLGKQYQLLLGCCGGLHWWGKQNFSRWKRLSLNWAGFYTQYKWCSPNVPYQTSDLFCSLNNLCFHPQEEDVFLYMGCIFIYGTLKSKQTKYPIQKFDILILGELYLHFLLEDFSLEDGCNWLSIL